MAGVGVPAPKTPSLRNQRIFTVGIYKIFGNPFTMSFQNLNRFKIKCRPLLLGGKSATVIARLIGFTGKTATVIAGGFTG